VASALLEIRHLSVSYPGPRGPVPALRDFSLEVLSGETLALVGETGCGKSTVALATLGLVDLDQQLTSGEILFGGKNLLHEGERYWRRMRGSRIGMVFQDAGSSLNPVLTIGEQLIESIRSHQNLSRREARERALALLQEVGIPDPPSSISRYAFEFSGGMCQRIGIALGLCGSPELLIADEPTSALDPTIQAQILDLLRKMRRHHNLALLLISHDLALVAECADRVAVMYHGRLVEAGRSDEVFVRPAHPYTRALIHSLPRLDSSRRKEQLTPVLGSPPAPGQDLPGCAFAPRCPIAEIQCTSAIPPQVALSDSHWASCIKAG